MTARELFARLRTLEVRLSLEGGRVRVSAPPGVLTENIQREIRTHKEAIRNLLELAVGAGNERGILSSITLAQRGEGVALSFAQQRLWFLAQMEGVSEAYHISFGLRLKGELDRVALRRVLERVVARHEALRTTFASVEGEPVQRITSVEDTCFHLREHDLREHEEAQVALDRLIVEEARASFDLGRGPLIRGRLIRLGEDEHALLITMHHIVSDGWSMGIFAHELSALYGAFVLGEDDPLEELRVQYADYAVWQRKWMEGELLREQAEYWKSTLAGAPGLLELPTDKVRPGEKDYAGAFTGVELDGKLTAGLREWSRRHGTTMYMRLLAGWAALLGRLSGQQDVVIGTAAANRGRKEIEGLIGFFVNTLALRLDVSGSPTVGELLEQAKAQAIAAQQHQDIPFEQVVEVVRPVRSLGHSPVFQVMFAWATASEGRLKLAGLEIEALEMAPHGVAKFDLTLALQEAGERIVGGVEYATSLYERTTVERYLGYFRKLLEGMVADELQAVDRIPILSVEERHQLLHEWNDTEAEYPRDKCVHELFEEQVKRTPEAVAVVFEDANLTYGELNRRANQLAHYLRGLGVKPDERVGICVERGLEMVVGLLAILKAGGAYVPLDPAYPVERLRYMLEDSAPVVLLTQGHLQELLGGIRESLPVLDLTDANPPWNQQPETDLDRAAMGLTPEHLAYVIYTSGSTGEPKGVMVEHRGLRNTLVYAWKRFAVCDQDVMVAVASSAFDISLLELVTPWLAGACSVILSRMEILDVELLVNRLKGVTILHTVPSLMRQVIGVLKREEAEYPANLRSLLIGGDMVAADLLGEMREVFPDCGIRVLYGPTEATIICAQREIGTYGGSMSPIGRPIANARIYILDGQGEPV